MKRCGGANLPPRWAGLVIQREYANDRLGGGEAGRGRNLMPVLLCTDGDLAHLFMEPGSPKVIGASALPRAHSS